MQTKSGKAEINRQGLVDLGTAVVEKIGRIGNGRRNAVANRVDGYRTPVEMSQVEQLQPELALIAAKKRLVRAKPDVAPGIEVEFVQRFGKRRRGGIEIRRGQVAGAAHDIVEIEFRRRLRRLTRLGRRGPEKLTAERPKERDI